MVRILYVNNSADRYGASRCLLRLIERLPRDRFEAAVLLPERGPFSEALENAGIEVILDENLSVITRSQYSSIGRLISFLIGIPCSAWRLRRIIVARRIDVLHTNVGTIVSTGLAARISGAKHIWHIRDWYQEFEKVWWLYEKYIRWSSDVVASVSTPIANQFGRSSRVRVVHDGFDLAEFDVDRETQRRRLRGELGIGMDEFVVACVGRIKWVRKGQEVAVRAVGRLKKDGIRMRLLLAGSPFPGNEDHLERLRDLIAKVDIVKETIYLGEVPDTKPVYSASDVVALTSCQPEPFGGVVIEGMCMERPVIATNLGGSLEQVEDRVTGYLVEPGDDEALAARLREFLEDREKARRFGVAGKERVGRLFGLDEMVLTFETIYEDLASKGTRER